MSDKIVYEHEIRTREVLGRTVTVTQSVWASGGLSYDLYEDGELLTTGSSFDDEPQGMEIADVLTGVDTLHVDNDEEDYASQPCLYGIGTPAQHKAGPGYHLVQAGEAVTCDDHWDERLR